MNTGLVIEALRSEWGAGRIVAVGRFGSTASLALHSRYSDIDLAVVVDGEPGVPERDAASRAIKRRLRLGGDRSLYGFNFFPRAAFQAMVAQPSWLAASIARTFQPLLDPSAMFAKLRVVPETVPFGWLNVGSPPVAAYRRLIELHERAAATLAGDEAASRWYAAEALRLRLLERCREAGLYLSRASILDAAAALEVLRRRVPGERELHRQNYFQLTTGEYLWSHPSHVERHFDIAARLRREGLTLLALRHAYNAARLAYLRRLHRAGFHILDGEVSHAFLLHGADGVPADVVALVETSSLLAEQVLGRIGIASFDVDRAGDGVYEQLSPTYAGTVYLELMDILGTIARAVEALPAARSVRSVPSVSIVIPTHGRAASLARTLSAVDDLIMPEEQMEVIVVHDGEPSPVPHRLRFPTVTLGKPFTGVGATRALGAERAKGEYVLFLDDDVIPSPTWALRLLQAADTGAAALVGSTILSVPPESLTERYCDDRELLRRPVSGPDGAITNVITASALLRRDALERIGRLAEFQVRRGVLFGGEDVDLTWAVIEAGLGVAHATRAVTFHKHRASLFALIRQHVGYGRGTANHCLERRRLASELCMAEASVSGVVADTLRYATGEVPRRLLHAVRQRRAERLLYPFLDLLRRCAYNAGILIAAREATPPHE